MSIAIVTDSTADIPAALIEEHHIAVVPAILIVDGQSLEDGKGITREEFYERIPTMSTPPTTATPSSEQFARTYRRLLAEGFEQIISIHVAGVLSGICNAAHLAASAFEGRVRVVDSGSLSMGLGFQVLAAAENAARGLSLEAVLEKVANIRQRIRVFAMLDTLEYVRRSGRVSWARARIGSLLQIKPFLEVKEGQVLNMGQARTRQKGIAHLRELLLNLGPLERLAILHTNAEVDARRILEEMKARLPFQPLLVNVTTIVGTHVGPNGLGFTAVLQ